MCDTPFKVPLSYRTPKKSSESDSGSTPGFNSDESTSSNATLTLIAEFDDLIRHYHHLKSDKISTEAAFSSLAAQTKLLFKEFNTSVLECRRLQSLVEQKTHDCNDLESKLLKARNLLHTERSNTRTAQKQRDEILAQLDQVRDVLIKGKDQKLSDETRRKLSFLNNNNQPVNFNGAPQLSAIKEINSTGSILSDFSYSRSEDDLDNSYLEMRPPWKKHRPSNEGVAEPATKKRRSSGNRVVEIAGNDTVRATTTLTLNKDGPITATSTIEAVPPTATVASVIGSPSAPPANLVFESWARDSPRKPERNINSRQHIFQQRTIVMPDTCSVCEKRIRFGRTALKCKECKALCHLECKANLPLPCIPLMNTPNQRTQMGAIGDYTPTTPPMVPALVIHCVNEIELRGLNEIGIYRIPGSEREVKALKEKFLRGRGSPCLSQIEIHVVCGVVKDFLRTLNEPLITYALWKDFATAVDARNPADVWSALYEVLAKLPQPNRDTLAYMIVHLQKISEAKDCKMDISSLAKIFGPTLIGFSSEDPNTADLLMEVQIVAKVMQHLLEIPRDYWLSFIDIDSHVRPLKLQQTPSTDSLLRSTTTRGFFTPNRNLAKKKQKYFPSPL